MRSFLDQDTPSHQISWTSIVLLTNQPTKGREWKHYSHCRGNKWTIDLFLSSDWEGLTYLEGVPSHPCGSAWSITSKAGVWEMRSRTRFSRGASSRAWSPPCNALTCDVQRVKGSKPRFPAEECSPHSFHQFRTRHSIKVPAGAEEVMMVLKWFKDGVCLCDKCHLLCTSAAEEHTLGCSLGVLALWQVRNKFTSGM